MLGKLEEALRGKLLSSGGRGSGGVRARLTADEFAYRGITGGIPRPPGEGPRQILTGGKSAALYRR
jgi:hypothetical protein